MKAPKKKNWIKEAIKRPGALRKKLNIKAGKKITTAQLNKALKSKNSRTRRQANLAKTLKKRVGELVKKFSEREQYELNKKGGFGLPHPDAPVLRNIKHGGKVQYRSIGGKVSGNDIIKMIYD